MSLTPDTSPLPHEDPAGFLRAAHTRLTVRTARAELVHEAALLQHEAITEHARLLPLAHGRAKAAQDWLIASLYEVAHAELDEAWTRFAWLDAEDDLLHALAAEHGIDLDDDAEGAGHG